MLSSNQISTMRIIVEAQFTSSQAPAGRARAEKFLHDRVICSPSFRDVPFRAGDIWSERDERTHGRYLHGFIFFSDWYGTILADAQTKDAASSAALEIITSWHAENGAFPGRSSMAYHDETTAQRLINLLRLDKFLSVHNPSQTASLIRPLMDRTAALLAENEFHSAGNNHGMFQDLALMYYAILAEWIDSHTRDKYLNLSLKRLGDYFNTCFTSDGVHVENTPTYHVMVSRKLAIVQRLAKAANHPDAAHYSTLLSKAEEYATHALMPNGLYPPISDTAQKPVSGSAILGVFSSEEFLHAATAGRKGTPAPERILVLPDTGYLIYRSTWGDPKATYLFFSAAYNAGYHKHSDDLSIFLRSGGFDLLAESGPYGYDYKNPFSRYAYSQFSHNSLVVDGKSLPRTDAKASTVQLRALKRTDQCVEVEGVNGRYDDTVHKRRVVIDESTGTPEIVLADKINSKTDHHYQLLWNLGTEVSVVLHGQGFELFYHSKKLMDLTFTANVTTAVTLYNGQMKPRPMGWTFPAFGEAVPSNTVSVSFSGRSAEIETSIQLTDFFYENREIFQEKGWSLFLGKVPLNYLFQPPKDGPITKMVVVFTAIHGVGDFTYNYKSTLDRVDVAALYILDDFGDQGSYYYSDHRSTVIFETVQSLIKKVMEDYGLSESDVATAGSSKGGAAALIHGLALGADRIFSGAPQTRIGSFLRSVHPNILRFMSGGTTEDDVSYLDAILPGLMKDASSRTKIMVLVGDADHHLRKHVVPLSQDAAKFGVNISTLILPGAKHADIGRLFAMYLQANVHQWVHGVDEEALPYELSLYKPGNGLSLSLQSPENATHSFRLYRAKECVERVPYSKQQSVTFANLEPGRYRVRVFTRLAGSTMQQTFTTRYIKVPSALA